MQYANINCVVEGSEQEMNLLKAKLNTEYIVKDVKSEDGSMIEFLFSLGCYPGEKVLVISKLASNLIISVKDARYSIDEELAKCILLED